ncbi:MAG: cation:proton antiporter [Flavobacteriales bacterium]|nr:cation:proton antiporter [Flavobacteriales bacterium]
MKNLRDLLFYVAVIGGFSALMYAIIHKGAVLEEGRDIAPLVDNGGAWQDFISSMAHNLAHPLFILLAQIVTIILAARVFGWICKKIGQPTVIGEIIAGIVLGPSLVGLYFPEFSNALFPAASLGNLQFLSQIGLILFMFVVGMELDLKVLRNKAHDAVVISHASIVIPFALGVGLAWYVYGSFAPQGVRFSSFALFLGIAMSITAFPVLARIVQERGLHRTRLGTVVITCAAADDITAWCLLAAVIAIVKAGTFVSALYTIALAAVYVVLMLKVVRPFLRRVGELHVRRENLSKPIVAIFFLTLLLSAMATEVIGIHALFGAFMAGAIMPENVRFRNLFIEKVEDVALVLLLPLFFVFTGLRTQIGLLNDPYLWKVTAAIIGVAIVGKFVGSALAARFVGQSWRESLTIGALMNTRGLMELVVLNIGYDLGVLTPEIFAMMVIMALVTTFMTGPALSLIDRLFGRASEAVPAEIQQRARYRVLLAFGDPDRGRALLRVAHALVARQEDSAEVVTMHLSPSNELHHYNLEEYERESFGPMLQEANHLGQRITTLFKATSDIEQDITEVANRGEFDLLLVGVGRSIYEGSLLGKVLGFTTRIINPGTLLNTVTGRENPFEESPFDERTRNVLARAQVPVGVLLDKGLEQVERVFIPLFSAADEFLLEHAQKLIRNGRAQITVLDATGHVKGSTKLKEWVRSIAQTAPNHIILVQERMVDKELLAAEDLMLISAESWKGLVDSKSVWLAETPSVLVVTKGAS